MSSRKPVLALAEKGPIEELMKKSRCGVLVDHDDTEKIKEEILNYYNQFKEGQLAGILNKLNQNAAEKKAG